MKMKIIDITKEDHMATNANGDVDLLPFFLMSLKYFTAAYICQIPSNITRTPTILSILIHSLS